MLETQSGNAVHCVSESADGFHIVSRDSCKSAIIWHRESLASLWISNKEHFFRTHGGFENIITNAEAEKIIRNCGQQTPRLWPNCFSAYEAEFYCEDGSMYSNSGGDKTLISERIPGSISWNFHTEGKVLAVGLEYGNVVISALITE